MKDIKCTIIQDLLPLYIDEVVSVDTQQLVDEHLASCPSCQQECEAMKTPIALPIDNKLELLHNINRRWNHKKWGLILGSVFSTITIGFAIFLFVFYFEKPIPYSSDLFKIEELADGTLVSNYYGESHAGSYMMHPLEINVDGEMKNIIFVYYSQTIADSPTRNLFSKEGKPIPYSFTLPDSKEVDAVYYGEYTFGNTLGQDEQAWKGMLAQMTLIWERQ